MWNLAGPWNQKIYRHCIFPPSSLKSHWSVWLLKVNTFTTTLQLGWFNEGNQESCLLGWARNWCKMSGPLDSVSPDWIFKWNTEQYVLFARMLREDQGYFIKSLNAVTLLNVYWGFMCHWWHTTSHYVSIVLVYTKVIYIFFKPSHATCPGGSWTYNLSCRLPKRTTVPRQHLVPLLWEVLLFNKWGIFRHRVRKIISSRVRLA